MISAPPGLNDWQRRLFDRSIQFGGIFATLVAAAMALLLDSHPVAIVLAWLPLLVVGALVWVELTFLWWRIMDWLAGDVAGEK